MSDRAPGLDPDRYRAVLSRFVTGVTIVTTLDHRDGVARPFGTTVNAFSSVSLDPPLILVTIGRERSILPVLARTRRFAVSILAEEGQALSDCFAGGPSVAPREDFCGARWHPSVNGQPLLADALAWISCELERTIEAGDHTIHLGRVVDLSLGQNEGWPLLYWRRQYLRIEHAASVALQGKPDAT